MLFRRRNYKSFDSDFALLNNRPNRGEEERTINKVLVSLHDPVSLSPCLSAQQISMVLGESVLCSSESGVGTGEL